MSAYLRISAEGQSGSVFGIGEYWGLSKRRQGDLEKEYPGILIKKHFEGLGLRSK